MTISVSFPIFPRPWQGYDDPGLPIGMWIGQGETLGDASGGNQNVSLIFKGEGELLGARFYNLEQVEAHSTNLTLAVGSLVLENFDVNGPTGLADRRLHLPFGSDGVTNSALIDGIGPRLPKFLGRPVVVDVITQIRLQVANVLNETVFFTAQGFIWLPRSLLEDGGLRRPVDSMYG